MIWVLCFYPFTFLNSYTIMLLLYNMILMNLENYFHTVDRGGFLITYVETTKK